MVVVLVNRFTVRTQARRLFIRHRPSLSFFCAGLAGFPRTLRCQDPWMNAEADVGNGSDQAVPANYLPTGPAALRSGKAKHFCGDNPNQLPPARLRAEMRG